MVNSDGTRFLWKIHFCPNLDKKGPKNKLFYIFLKNLSFVLPKNNAKWNFFNSSISIVNPMSGKILVRELLPKMLFTNQIARFL